MSDEAEDSGLAVSKILLPALRQYMHNNGVGLLAAYDYDRTESIVSKLVSDADARIAELEESNRRWVYRIKHRGVEMDMLSERIAELESQLNDRIQNVCQLQAELDALKAQSKGLVEALNELVKINEDHNKAVQEIIGGGVTLGWKDSYLDKAREALAPYRAAREGE